MDLLKAILEKINISADVQATIKKDMTEEETVQFLQALGEDHAKTWLTESTAIKNEKVRGVILNGKLSSIEKKLSDGFGLTADQIKDKKVEDIIELATTAHATKIEELKGQINEEAGEALKKANLKSEDLAKSLKEKTDLLTGAATTIEEAKTEFETFKADIHLGGLVSDERRKVKLIQGEHAEMAESHFNSKVSEMLRFKQDEQGLLIVTDPKGNQIQSKANAAKVLSPFEALDNLASTLKVKQMSKGGGEGGSGGNGNGGQGGNGSGGNGEDKTKGIPKHILDKAERMQQQRKEDLKVQTA